MKKIYSLFFCLVTLYSFSQVPKQINYQGVIRKANGAPFTNAASIRFEIFPVASGGTAVFSEVQSTNTNSLGLFNTRIGSTVPLTINWSTGQWFLEVSVDTVNATNFVSLGRQQLVSVPFAIYAESAGSAPDPSVTFSNNILYVGTNSVSIPAPPALFAGNGISITSGTISNSAPDQTVTINGTGNAQVTSAYPDFTVNVNPQTLAINSNSISLSNGGGTIVLPATSTTPNTSLTASGIATVTSLGTNTFNINVPATSITGVSPTIVSGTFPNYTISTAPPPTMSITGTGIASVNPLSGNGFTVNVPPPALSLNSNILTVTQGTSTSNVTLPPSPPPVITGAGIATVTPSGNNFTVNVAPPTLVGTGITSIGGTYPNLTVSTPSYALSFPTNSTALISNGVSSSSATIPQPVFTGTNGISVSGTGPTFTIGLNNSSATSAWSTLGNANTGATNFLGTTDNMPLRFRTNNTQVGQFTPSGAFAIGTGGPTSTLSVFGNMAVGSTFASGGAAPANSAIFEGTIGVGTQAPATRIDVVGLSTQTVIFNNAGSPETSLRLKNNDLTNNNYSSLIFGTMSTGAGNYESAKIVGLNSNHTNGSMTGELVFMTRNPGNINEVMRLTANGLVGIGTNAPAENLQVESSSGNTKIGIIAPSTSLSSVWFGRPGFHDAGKIDFNHSTNEMAFSTVSGSPAFRLFNNGTSAFGSNLASNPAGSFLHIAQTGANNTKVLISGGDNSNSYGGMLSFGENLSSFSGMTIRLEAVWNRLIFTNDLAGSSSVMSVGGYAGSNPGVTIGNGYTFQNPPVDGLIVQGNVGVGTASPAEKVDVNGNVRVQGAGEYLYSTPKLHYYNVPVNALHSMRPIQYNLYMNTYVAGYDGESGYAYFTDGTAGSDAVATAPVYLPDGATVTELMVRYFDGDATYNLTVSLERKPLGTINNATMASFTSTGNSSGPSSAPTTVINTISNAVIDNLNNSYYVKFKSKQANTSLGVLDIRVAYTVNKAD